MITNIKIESLDDYGRGITYINNKICFVINALPNEIVDIEVIKENKKYYVARVINYITESNDRIRPLCPYYNKCRGCSLSILNYDKQIEYKKNKLSHILNKFANIKTFIEILKCDNEYNYRNKIELKIINYEWGYYNSESHDFVSINECFLAKESINNIIKCKDLFKIKDGNITIKSNYNNEILIKIDTKDNFDINISKLKENNKLLGIIVNNNIYYGEKEFIEIVNGYYYKVDINSFFQVNLNILSKIFNILKDFDFNTVVDLYCGVGTLGIATQKKELYGIEIIPEAIINANTNAKINKQTNNYYLLGDSSNISKIEHKIDAIIIDPPRSGLSKETINNLIKINPSKIIYMSCDPVTLSRDLKILNDYKVIKCYLVDMFPQTYHVESLVILEKIKKEVSN